MKYFCSTLTVSLLLCFLQLNSAYYGPWLGNEFEVEFDSSYSLSHYGKFDGTPMVKSMTGSEFLFGISGTLPGGLAAELEVEFSDTTNKDLSLEHVQLMGKYILLDDIVGDVVTLTAGAAIRAISSNALHDPISFYSGNLEGELFASMGKEMPRGESWLHRIWGFTSIQLSNKGRPAIKTGFFFDKNFMDEHLVQLFSEYTRSFGKSKTFVGRFSGFGELNSKFMDLGLRYYYRWGVNGTLYAKFAYRLFGVSAPENGCSFQLGFEVPFSV